ncbi:MAG TPA: DoxX family membrane protein [Candidatus Luteococcus avicola]|uniref:DoxX family membrane protein n=1 Tax=Luteococcus sanguinis TaxID=174038 RepID=A0ABW1X275_9ACTN|nr:DoxX family membrane protein [Candidatus Luteococcus avicola]
MSLTRAAGRTMLASFFVVNGAKAAANPTPLVGDAEPIARKVVPLAQRLAPPSAANYIPEDTKQLVRLSGVAQLLGGLGLATGLARRPSAALLGASMVPHVMASRPTRQMSGEARTAARSVMLRNVALLGATLIAAQDTQGKPSLGYRASSQARQVRRDASRQQKALAKAAKKQARSLDKTSSRIGKQATSHVSQITDQIESALS